MRLASRIPKNMGPRLAAICCLPATSSDALSSFSKEGLHVGRGMKRGDEIIHMILRMNLVNGRYDNARLVAAAGEREAMRRYPPDVHMGVGLSGRLHGVVSSFLESPEPEQGRRTRRQYAK
jgi:hypothetical protein